MTCYLSAKVKPGDGKCQELRKSHTACQICQARTRRIVMDLDAEDYRRFEKHSLTVDMTIEEGLRDLVRLFLDGRLYLKEVIRG